MSAYLTFSPSDGAKLTLTFSDTPLKGALLIAAPKKAVPAFKKGKADEMMRGMQLERSKYFNGIAQFIKAVRAYDATIQFGDDKGPIPFQIVFLNGKNEISKLCGTMPTTDYTAVAVIGSDCQDLNTKVMDRTLFLSKARVNGSSIELR